MAFGVVIFLILQSFCTRAEAAACARANGSSHTLTIDVVNVPRDQANNTRITDWKTLPGENARLLNCDSDNSTDVGGRWYNHSMTSTGTTYSESGASYTVYKTNITGIGIVVRAQYATGQDGAHNVVSYTCFTYATFWSAYYDLSATPGQSCWTQTGQINYVYYGGKTQMALIKTGAFTDGSKVQVSDGWRFSAQVGTDYHWGGTNMDHLFSVTTTVVNMIRCTTPDVTVVLGTHAPSEFAAVGSRTTPVKFDLEVNNCGKGMAKVSYGFNLASGVTYTAKDGLFGLRSGATAKGISVKLMKGDGTTAVELDKFITLTNYNATQGGSYKVPLSAAYQRTGDVTPGSADAELIIAMSYE